MTTQTAQVRRATIEDLPRLVELWQAEKLAVVECEKHFKEFQVVEEEGKVTGAVALQIVGGDGLLHSEVFAHPEHADTLREKLWERVRMIAGNHGLFRLWSQLAAPYWKSAFQEASAELTAKVPAAFAKQDRPWLYVQLKEDVATDVSLDKEFALFREAEREQTQKLFQQARFFKVLAIGLGIGVLILVVVWAFMFLKTQNRLKTRGAPVGPEVHLRQPDFILSASANG